MTIAFCLLFRLLTKLASMSLYIPLPFSNAHTHTNTKFLYPPSLSFLLFFSLSLGVCVCVCVYKSSFYIVAKKRHYSNSDRKIRFNLFCNICGCEFNLENFPKKILLLIIALVIIHNHIHIFFWNHCFGGLKNIEKVNRIKRHEKCKY